MAKKARHIHREVLLVSRDIHALLGSVSWASNIYWYFRGFRREARNRSALRMNYRGPRRRWSRPEGTWAIRNCLLRVDGHIGQLGVESSPTRVGERGKGMLQFWIKVRFAAGRPRFAQRGRQTL